MRIIAFGHRQGVGKSTATRFLISELRLNLKNKSIQQAGLADKVKDVAHQLFNWAGLEVGSYYENHYELKNKPLPSIGLSPRALWIGVGNGIRQATGYDDTWFEFLYHNVFADYLIITDLRFPGEARQILNKGGSIYRIDRAACPKITDGADDPLEDFKDWTGVITNDTSMGELYTKIADIAYKEQRK